MNKDFMIAIWRMKIKGILMFVFGIFLSCITVWFLFYGPDIFPDLFEGRKYDTGSTILSIMIIFLIFIWIYFSIFVKNFENKIKKKFAPKIMRNLVKDDGDINWISNIIHLGEQYNNRTDSDDIDYRRIKRCGILDFFQVFKGFCSFKFKDLKKDNSINLDDFFYGTYKGAEFVSVEAEISTKKGKYYWTTFKGLIIEIKTNRNFSPMLIKSNSQPYLKTSPEYKKIYINNKNFSSKYSIYTKEGTEIPQFSTSFYSFINDLWKMFSFGFIEDRIVVIVNAKKDLFKLGSLFKSLNNESQYKQFRDEFFLMLNIIENLSNMMKDENI